jgi:hypothetical protein
MSIIPFTNFTVIDLSNVQQPYVNSCTEYGYFSGGNLGTIANGLWSSLPGVLTTNNGIASLDASGLRILNPGIYSINLSIFPTTTQDGSSNISFNFGTRYLFNDSSTNVVNAFGGPRPTGMFTYDPSNNPYSPGIISWVADGYNSANSTTNNFIKNSTTNELSYNYFNAGYPTSNALYSGNCTTEMTFVVDSSATIFLNILSNSTTGVTMGNCFFTLELVCNNTALIPSLNWHISGAPSTTWSSIVSDSGGSKLAACGTRIWTSNNYGVNWTLQIVNNLNWSAIAISGQAVANPYMAACVNGGYIYSSSDNGVNWFQRTFVPLNWTGIAPNYIATTYAACANGGGIWYSGNAGVTWTQKNADLTKKWSCITSSDNMATIYACESPGSIWKITSLASTPVLTQQTSNSIPTNANWSSISMNYGADKIIACIDGGAIWFTTSSGTTWTISSNAGNLSWSSISLGAGNTANCYACVKGGGIYKSINSGLNWSLITGPPNPANWSSITTDNGGGQVVACVKGGYIYVSTNTGGTWVQATFDATRDWSNVACNYSTFAAVVSNGPYIYIPNNNNTNVLNWTQQNTEFNRTWTSIASDSTRTILAACASGNTGGIWTSSDSGLNWTPRTSLLPSGSLPTNVTWSSIASDSSGTNLAACVNGGGIYTSITSGSSWTLQTNPGSRSWTSIASDGGGTNLAACVNGGTIYTSSDSGVTWTPRTVGLPTTAIWTSIASNSTGTNLAACVNGGYIYTSTDSGGTWTTNSNSSGIKNWTSIASDGGGTNLAACVNGGGIWVSTNSGVTWSQQTTAPTANWSSIESSSTGANLAATALNSGIYTRLNI